MMAGSGRAKARAPAVADRLPRTGPVTAQKHETMEAFVGVRQLSLRFLFDSRRCSADNTAAPTQSEGCGQGFLMPKLISLSASQILACLVGAAAGLVPVIERTRPFWGLEYTGMADSLGLVNAVWIDRVTPDSPAARAGFWTGTKFFPVTAEG